MAASARPAGCSAWSAIPHINVRTTLGRSARRSSRLEPHVCESRSLRTRHRDARGTNQRCASAAARRFDHRRKRNREPSAPANARNVVRSSPIAALAAHALSSEPRARELRAGLVEGPARVVRGASFLPDPRRRRAPLTTSVVEALLQLCGPSYLQCCEYRCSESRSWISALPKCYRRQREPMSIGAGDEKPRERRRGRQTSSASPPLSSALKAERYLPRVEVYGARGCA